MTEKNEHNFVVTVSGCSQEQAEQVLNERISPEEDYGFDYEIGYAPEKPSPRISVCKCRAGDIRVEYTDGRTVDYLRKHEGHVHGAKIGDEDPVAPAGVITREQVAQWAGRELTDRDVRRLMAALPESTVPEAIGAIVDGMR